MTEKTKQSEKPTIWVDVEKYDHLLDHSEMSEEERAAFLQEVWNLIVALVDFGFGVHPVQRGCGQVRLNCSETRADGADRVYSEYGTLLNAFEKSVDDETDRAGKDSE